MKTIKILIASLILVSQSYAFSKSERRILLGLGVGAVVAYAIHENDIHVRKVHHGRTVYVDAHDAKRKYKKHKKHVKHHRMHDSHHNHHRRHHAKHQRRHHRDMHRYERVAFNYPNYSYRY